MAGSGCGRFREDDAALKEFQQRRYKTTLTHSLNDLPPELPSSATWRCREPRFAASHVSRAETGSVPQGNQAESRRIKVIQGA
jgi:hypothetical protein